MTNDQKINNFVSNILLKLTAILAFFPFVSPYPIGTDTQPVFFILAALCLLAKHGTIKLKPVAAFMPTMALSLVYFSDLSNWSPLDFTRLSFAAIAFLFFLNFAHILTARFIFAVATINFALIFLHFLMPKMFVSVFEPIVRVIKVDEIGVRGASGLAPEPGFAGAVLVSTFAMACLRREFFEDSHYFYVLLAITVLGVFLTRSGTGSLYLIIFFSMYFFTPRRAFLLASFLVVAYFSTMYVDFGRGASSLRYLLSSPFEAVLVDASIGARVLNILIGFVAVFDSPLGFGFDSYDDPAWNLAHKYSLFNYAVGNIGRLSAFATYTVFVGIIWWITLGILIFSPIRKNGIRCVPFIGFSVLLLSVSFSVAFPLTWALLGSCWAVSSKQMLRAKCDFRNDGVNYNVDR